MDHHESTEMIHDMPAGSEDESVSSQEEEEEVTNDVLPVLSNDERTSIMDHHESTEMIHDMPAVGSEDESVSSQEEKDTNDVLPVLSNDEQATQTDLIHSSSPKPDPPRTKPNTGGGGSLFLSVAGFLRSLLFELPLLVILFFYTVATVLAGMHSTHFFPLFTETQFFTNDRSDKELTYYDRICDEEDLTATSREELIVDINLPPKFGTQKLVQYGVAMFPNVLSDETASELRNFIVEENKRRESWFVIENENRYSWGIDVNMHPGLQQAWKEVASNEHLMGALTSLVGPDPGVIEYTAITSSYGAIEQEVHPDVQTDASGAKFARTFSSPYSLFVPLQDTTYEMGATHVCPGSHLCAEEKHCTEMAFPLSDYDKVWPRGWGAVYNQQTSHRGAAHIDPNGPDRVILIMTFVPRPYSSGGYDRRMVSLGGTYSILWNHWGHTLSDYVHADTRMTEPQKTLRSLGLIESNGWNLLDTIIMRLPNDDSSFEPEELEGQIARGDFWFIPKPWLGTDTEDRTGIYHDFIFDTIFNIKAGLQRIYVGGLGLYLLALTLLFWVGSEGRRRSRRWLIRLCCSHGFVVLIVLLLFQQWKKHLRSPYLFRPPEVELEAQDGEILTPATIPVGTDILITPDYSWDVFGEYSRVLDFAHPGNRKWMMMTKANSAGYHKFPAAMQVDLSTSMTLWVRETARFLKQDSKRRWVEVLDQAELDEICHKQLLMASHPFSEAMLRQLDSLKSETVWGRWRGMAIYNTVTPAYLENWETKLFRPLMRRTAQNSGSSATIGPFFRRLVSLPSPTVPGTPPRSTIPPAPQPEPPETGAWTKEGDVVDGMFQCEVQEWYRGTITRIHPHNATYDVVYDDGYPDLYLPGYCVKPHIMYNLAEIVFFQKEELGSYQRAHVVKIYPEGEFYDLSTDDGGWHRKVPPRRMLRMEEMFIVGMRVEAFFDDGETQEWYLGRIGRHNYDGSFGVDYDDGEVDLEVPVENLRVPLEGQKPEKMEWLKKK